MSQSNVQRGGLFGFPVPERVSMVAKNARQQTAGAGSWLVTSVTQEAQRVNDKWARLLKALRVCFPHHNLVPEWLSNFLPTASSTGDQVFKYVSLWGTHSNNQTTHVLDRKIFAEKSLRYIKILKVLEQEGIGKLSVTYVHRWAKVTITWFDFFHCNVLLIILKRL